jgi:hypothetical protein
VQWPNLTGVWEVCDSSIAIAAGSLMLECQKYFSRLYKRRDLPQSRLPPHTTMTAPHHLWGTIVPASRHLHGFVFMLLGHISHLTLRYPGWRSTASGTVQCSSHHKYSSHRSIGMANILPNDLDDITFNQGPDWKTPSPSHPTHLLSHLLHRRPSWVKPALSHQTSYMVLKQ